MSFDFSYKAFIDEHDRQLTADEVAEGAISMLSTSLKVSINALNIMPTREYHEKISFC